jgi:hypothetical protein
VQRSADYRTVEVELGVRLALAAHHDDDEALGCSGGATEMAANGRAEWWRSVVVEEEDDALWSTLRERCNTSGLGEGARVTRTRWYL